MSKRVILDAFFRHHFQRSPFSPVHTRKDAFAKRSTLNTAVKSLCFHQRFRAFSVDSTRKRIQKYAFGRVVGALLSKRKDCTGKMLARRFDSTEWT